MKREILINQEAGEIRVAVLEDGRLVEIHVERPETERVAGNIYNARVENVLPGMQAAFVNIGLEKNAFLYVADAVPAVNFDEVEGEGTPKLRRGMAINKMLKNGQKVVVQVIKDPIGTKGARVSAYVTLPGHLVVLMPSVDYVGVSRRIADPKERQRLRQLATKAKPRGMGLIVRTAAEDHELEDIKAEAGYLHSLWRRTKVRARGTTAPRMLHRDLGLIGRVVRDLLNQSVTRVVTDSPEVHGQVRELLQDIAPTMRDRLELFDSSKQDLFAGYGIEDDLERALQRRVWLKSGGYLVIDETEAFTVFDVNTGRYVGSTSLAQTVLDTNLEAAGEIARQLRLRDIGGIIIIDFIDMDIAEHRQKVLQCFEEHLRRDRTRSHVLGLTQLGLVEMTRKKVRQSLGEMLTKACPFCDGRGRVASEATMASRVRREMRKLMRTTESQALLVEVHPSVAALLIGPGGNRVRELEREAGKIIYIRGAADQTYEGFKFRTFDSRDDVQAAAIPVRAGDVLDLRVENHHSANATDGVARIDGFVLDIDGAGGLVGERVKVEVTKVHRTYAKARIIEPAQPARSQPPAPAEDGAGAEAAMPPEGQPAAAPPGEEQAAETRTPKRAGRSRSARRRRAARAARVKREEAPEGAPGAAEEGRTVEGTEQAAQAHAGIKGASGLAEAAATAETPPAGSAGQDQAAGPVAAAGAGQPKPRRRRGRRGRSGGQRKKQQAPEAQVQAEETGTAGADKARNAGAAEADKAR